MQYTVVHQSFSHVLLSILLCISVMHRYPTVSPDPPQWEVDYEKMKDKIENLNRQVSLALIVFS